MHLPPKPILFLCGAFLLAVVAAMLVPWGALRDRISPPAQAQPAPKAHDDHAGHDHGHEAHAEADHVDLSPTAKANLGLKTGRVRLTDYTRTLHIPGEVVEAPGYSTADVPARVAGVVTAIHISPGQAVRPGDPLFDLDLTGEALAEAQSRLLDDLQQLATTEAELERLGPLAEGGSVAAKQRLQLEYDRRRIEGQRNTRVQELLIRGLTRGQVDRILTNRELVRSVTVVVPKFPDENGDTTEDRSAATTGSAADDWEYTVETIDAHPGESVGPEESLCRLARHTRLYVRGHAFERDVPAIAALPNDGHVTVEFGGEGHAGGDGVSAAGEEGHGEAVAGLNVLYVDNHVDSETQTFSFYVPLRNEVLKDVVDDAGRVFRSWKYKPGQRVHVRIPLGRVEKQIVLPRDAIADEGPESFVFRLAARHARKEKGPNGETLSDDQFVPVPVVVRHRDSRQVVLAPGGALKTGDLVAMNRAYQLLLAMKTAAEGGAGHDHHGHSH